MADDSLMSMLGTGGSVAGGGVVSAVVVRALFASFKEELRDLSAAVRAFIAKSDDRHEKILERLAAVEAVATAAHRRLDEFDDPPRGRRR